jgi:hypothetical protein
MVVMLVLPVHAQDKIKLNKDVEVYPLSVEKFKKLN